MGVRRRAVVVGAGLLLAVSACGGQDETEDAAREACVEEAGGQATSSSADGDSVTVEGARDDVVWSCRAVYEDGAWRVDTRPGGGEPALP